MKRNNTLRKAKFLGADVEYDPAIFHPDRYPKRKAGQRCGVCDCYNGIRCVWGFRLKKDQNDWCFQFGKRTGGGNEPTYNTNQLKGVM